MKTVLITGANRGIGLAMTRQYSSEGAEVIACCRNPAGATALQELSSVTEERVRVMALDVADEKSIRTLKTNFGTTPIDIVINNAGISDPSGENIDPDIWLTTLRVNALGPMLIAQALHENLLCSGEKKLVAITSIMGSTTTAGAGKYAYRASKAALNNGMRALSRAWASEGILVGLLNPGWVQTDMVAGQAAWVSAEEAARGLISRISELTPNTSGVFQDYRGVVIRW